MSDLISREEVLTAFADYVGSGMSMNDYDALWNIVATIPPVKQEPTTDVLDKIRSEIENHCGLVKENHCKYCSYCNSVMGVREILELFDKYTTESEVEG